jgi:hypothetical protein
VRLEIEKEVDVELEAEPPEVAVTPFTVTAPPVGAVVSLVKVRFVVV